MLILLFILFRVCVQTVLPSDTIFILNCTGFKSNDQDTVVAQNIHHMHIQSISHWAPANIGPYSQAVQVTI